MSARFFDYAYIRKKAVVIETTRMEGSGELFPLLPRILWNLRQLKAEAVARLDVPGDEDEEGKLVRLLRARGERVTLLKPPFSKGWYDLQTTVKFPDTFVDLLSDPLAAEEYLAVFFLKESAFDRFLVDLANSPPSQRATEHLQIAECIVVDESDKERNLYTVYGPLRNEGTARKLILDVCDEFRIRVEETIDP